MHHTGTLSVRIFGFVLSLALTMAAYWIIKDPAYFHLTTHMAGLTILVLAISQALVQYLFFLQLREEGAYWNATVFASTVSIIFIIIFFSIWIMNNLDYLNPS